METREMLNAEIISHRAACEFWLDRWNLTGYITDYQRMKLSQKLLQACLCRSAIYRLLDNYAGSKVDSIVLE